MSSFILLVLPLSWKIKIIVTTEIVVWVFFNFSFWIYLPWWLLTSEIKQCVTKKPIYSQIYIKNSDRVHKFRLCPTTENPWQFTVRPVQGLQYARDGYTWPRPPCLPYTTYKFRAPKSSIVITVKTIYNWSPTIKVQNNSTQRIITTLYNECEFSQNLTLSNSFTYAS